MMRFGGTMTLNGLVLYVAYNFENVLLGRFWGAEAIGVYGRASQLIRIPTDNLNSAVGEVAFSALSRVQDDPDRLKRYFLKGYSLVLALTLPITIACALFANDLVLVLLGPKWKDATEIFRLLAPTILVFAMANPLRLAAQFARSRRARYEDRAGFRALHDCRLPHRVALWAQRCRICLLGRDDTVGRSNRCLGCARYCDFCLGYPADPKPPAGFERRGCGSCFWSTLFLWLNAVSFAPTPGGRYRPCHYLRRGALVRRRPEVILSGSASRIEGARTGRRKEPGFGLEQTGSTPVEHHTPKPAFRPVALQETPYPGYWLRRCSRGFECGSAVDVRRDYVPDDGCRNHVSVGTLVAFRLLS